MERLLLDEGALMALLKGHLDAAVFGILGLMSFVMLGYAIERAIFFARVSVTDYVDRPSVEVALTRHLTVIASVAANAPYVGLLGTVLGILVTFHDLSQGAGLAAATVMLGLALALKATAAGLLVAIPATLIYNGLLRRVDVLLARWASGAGRAP
ncbi:MAG: TonB-system energizer ExbB [Gammaproteobacteria bacterium]|nr:TonB-system energizer ExbB [Gammaproteobacteria bacterium]